MGRVRHLHAVLLLLFLTGLAGAASPLAFDGPKAKRKGPSVADRVESQITFTEIVEDFVTELALPGADRKPLLDRLEKHAERTQVEVSRIRLVRSAHAMGMSVCLPSPSRGLKCFVLLDQTMTVNAQAHVLIHELAHVLHMREAKLTSAQAEIVAETVAWLVNGALGIESRRESMSFLRQFPAYVRRATLEDHEQSVRRWATS